MASTNDITKARLVSKVPTDTYRSEHERIFGDKYAKQRKLQEGLQDGVQETRCIRESQEAESAK